MQNDQFWKHVSDLNSPFLSQIHVDRNRVTREDWHSFAAHRQQITHFLSQAAQGRNAPSLCVLGVGNGNDLDLARLASSYGSISLVDLDDEALRHCVERLPADIRQQLEVLGDVDVSGVLSLLDRFSSPGECPVSLDTMVGASRNPQPDRRLRTYDVVASTCLLTQLIDTARLSFQHRLSAGGTVEARPRVSQDSTDGSAISPVMELALAIRDGHLNLLTRLLRPQGTIVLVTDFVSSDTLPELRHVASRQLGKLVSAAINQGNFFSGANPMALAHWFASQFGKAAFDVTLSPPWRWTMGNRVFAAAAISARLNG